MVAALVPMLAAVSVGISVNVAVGGTETGGVGDACTCSLGITTTCVTTAGVGGTLRGIEHANMPASKILKDAITLWFI